MPASELTSADREQLLAQARQWIALAEAGEDLQNADRTRSLVQALESETARAERLQAEVQRLQSRPQPPTMMSPMTGPPTMMSPMIVPPSLGPPMRSSAGAQAAGTAAGPMMMRGIAAGNFGPVAPSAAAEAAAPLMSGMPNISPWPQAALHQQPPRSAVEDDGADRG